LGCMILGLAVDAPTDLRIALCLLPLTLGAGGVLASMLGMGLVRVAEGGSPQAALNKGTFAAAALSALFSWPIFHFTLGGRTFGDGIGAMNLLWAIVIGVVGGTLLGRLTEYDTCTRRRPVNSLVKASETGPAAHIVTGLGVGLASTALPILVMAGTVLLGYWQAGLFGVAIATLGVQLFLGIQLAVDAFGPIADNAGGLAEMSEQPPGVRANTDKLDAVGNTTAAIGKGFATASAALTSVVLFSAFKEETGVGTIEITAPMVLIGLLVGGMVPYLFSSSCMMA